MQMMLMLILLFGVNECIIDKHYHEAIQKWVKDAVHEIHKSYGCISQFERHHKELICL